MATQAEVTLKIKVDKGEAEKNLSAITTELNDVKKAQTELNAQLKAGAISSDEYGKKMSELKVKSQALQQQQTLATKVIQAQKGSTDELSNALALNIKQYNALSNEQRENSAVGGKLKKTITDQQGAMKDLNSSIGKPGLGGTLTNAISGMGTALLASGLAFVSVNTVAKVFNGVIGASQTAGDAWAVTMAGVTGTLDGLYRTIGTGDWSNLFDNMVKSAAAARQLTKDLDDLFETEISRDYRGAKIEESIADLTEKRDIARKEKNFKLTEFYVEEIKKKEKERDENAVRVAEKRAKTFTDNIFNLTGVTRAQQEKFLQVYNTKEYEAVKERADKFIEEENRIRNQTIMIQSTTGVLMKSISKSVADAQVEELKKRYTTEEIAAAELSKKLNSVNEKTLEDAAKALTDLTTLTTKHKEESRRNVMVGVSAGLKEDEFGNKTADGIADAEEKKRETLFRELQKTSDSMSKWQEEQDAQFQKDLDDELEMIVKNIDKKEELDKEKVKREKEYANELSQYYQEVEELKNEGIENEFEAEQARIDTFFSNLQLKLDAEREALLQSNEYAKLSNEEKIKIDEEYKLASGAIRDQKAKEDKEVEKEKMQFMIDTAANTISGIGELISSLAGKNKKAAITGVRIEEAASIMKIIASTAVGIMDAFKKGPIWGAIASVGILAAGVAQTVKTHQAANKSVTTINGEDTGGGEKKKGLKFALGGFIEGGSHQDGGVNINAEGGEFVVNKRAMMNPQIASFVNQANQYGNGATMNYNNSGLSQEIISAIQSIPVYIVESEITGMQRKVQVREAKFIR